MIMLPTGTRIWIIAGVTDMRCGFNGLASKVQNTLKDDPFSGHIFVFRGRSGKMVKILWADRDGLCLFAQRLERGRFVWPVTREGKVHLTPAQLSMLLEGIAWQHPKRTERLGIPKCDRLTRPLGLSNPSPAQMQDLNRLTVCAVDQQKDCGRSALFSI